MHNLSLLPHTTVSFMRFCKSISRFSIFLMLVLAAGQALANALPANNPSPSNVSNSLNIRHAELTLVEDIYELNADVDVKFNADMEEALNKGFEFNFLVEFQLAIPYQYWFDDEIATVTHRITLSYHALSRQYLLVRGDQQKAFASLDEVREDLGKIREIKVFNKADVNKGEAYRAALLVRLDHAKLPKALLEAESKDEWKMSSQRFEWVPALFK
jgi:hypothetical protein